MKKLITLCLSLALVLALAVPAAAADGPQLISAAPDPNGVSVMVNGEYVTFPEGVPEVTNGRTMVPMRAVLETLGAQVDYNADTRTVAATLDDTQLTHVIGTDVINVSPLKLTEDSLAAGGAVLTMDTVSYVKNGSTMVPLRFFSQALGYEVYWDGGARTAVVVDKQAVVEAIDKNFTIVNSAQAKQAALLDASGNLRMDMDFSGEIKLPELDAQPFSMEMSALYGPDAMNIEGTMDLSAVSAFMAALDGEEVPQEVEALLKDLSFRIICGDSMWMQMPALTGDAWMQMESAGMPAMGAMSVGSGTMGGVLYAVAEFASAEVPVMLYENLMQAGDLLTALFGDDTFTKDGEDYTWTLDEAKSARLAEVLGAESVSFPGSMTLTVKADGGCEFAMELDMDEVSLSLSGSSTGAASSVKCQVTVPEVCDVTFQGEASVAASDTAPTAAPPADAAVIGLDELASGDLGIIGGADGPTAIFTTAA